MALPSNAPVAISPTVLAASAALAVLSGLLFGLVPALRLSRVRIGAVLARNNRQGSAVSRRGSQLLIAAEVALAVVLVAGAGLMIRSFARVLNVEMGFAPDAFLTMEVTPLDPNAAVHAQFYPALLETLRSMPGIDRVGAIDHLPLAGSSSVTQARVEGRSVGIGIRQFLPGYFEAMGIPVRAGRLLTPADYAAGTAAAIVNETAAREMVPDGRAVGRELTVGKRTYAILGVVADIRHGGPFGQMGSEVFLPFTASADSLHRALALTIVVRPSGTNPDLASQLRRAAQRVGPRVLVERIRTGGDWLGDRVITPRRRTVLLGLLGGLGLVLAAVGVFGMTAYAVSRRTQEIGVRMAFGARPGVVVRQMLRDSAMPIAIGTIVGLGGAALATRLIASFLFQTDPIEPVTFAAVAALLMATGCLAAWIPARRAARVDPVLALRTE
jgi:predicted permease